MALFILIGTITGFVLGYFYPLATGQLQWLGETYIYLLVLVIQPFLFFNLALSVQKNSLKLYGKLSLYSLAVFLLTSTVAAIYAFCILKIIAFPVIIQQSKFMVSNINAVSSEWHFFQFGNLLLVIVPAIIVGSLLKQRKLQSMLLPFFERAAEITQKILTLSMLSAPLGFFAYSASISGSYGHAYFYNYFILFLVYAVIAVTFLICMYTIFIGLVLKLDGIKNFWRAIPLSIFTAFGTCSGIASIPANLIVANKLNVSAKLRDYLIPLGAVFHKDGTVIGAVMKIFFLYACFHIVPSGLSVYLYLFSIVILASMVMGAIPSGGFLGEALIISALGFPHEMLLTIAIFSLMIDPLATVLNVTGDVVCAVIVNEKLNKYVSEPISHGRSEEVYDKIGA